MSFQSQVRNILLTIMVTMFIINTSYSQQGQPGGGGQDPCDQYKVQCLDGSNLAGQGAGAGSAMFPNNPLPVDKVNMTAAQQMPHCEGLAAACKSQNQTAPAPPNAPSAPGVPTPPPPQSGGFIAAFKSLFNF